MKIGDIETLEQIANERGKGRICSNFIIGLEPAASVLEGAKYLGDQGVVPIASVWIPFGRPVEDSMKAPDLSYYRDVITGLGSRCCVDGVYKISLLSGFFFSLLSCFTPFSRVSFYQLQP